jgi:recombination protein RecR
MAGPGQMDRLIACLAKLPGVGRRSAERMAVRLIRERTGLARELVSALDEATRELAGCVQCGSITSASENPCALCTHPGRDSRLLCVVEDPADILAIEKSGGYQGRYHALMGKLSPMRSQGIQDLRLQALLERVSRDRVEEVILALNTDVESDATAVFIRERLADCGVRVTRLAFGLPVGSGIMYSDPVTLSRAMKGRQMP